MRSRSLCLAVLLLVRCASAADLAPRGAESDENGGSALSATFSIVAVDPESGVCGATVASKYPAVGKVVPHVRAGVGAFCTQHYHEPKYGPLALDLLEQGKLPEAVLAEILTDDLLRDQRQLAIIDLRARSKPRSGRSRGLQPILGRHDRPLYACQGNTLDGREVVTSMAEAYKESEGSLADRLIAALVAADRAGGDQLMQLRQDSGIVGLQHWPLDRLVLPLIAINALSSIAGVKVDWSQQFEHRSASAIIGDGDRWLALVGDATAENSEVFRQFAGLATQNTDLGSP